MALYSVLLVIIVTVVIKALANKISCLAMLMYIVDSGIDIPDNETISKYTQKAAKKMFHIPS